MSCPGHTAEDRDQTMLSPRRNYSQTTSSNFYQTLFLLFCAVVFLSLLGTTQATLSECKFTGTSGFCSGMAGKFITPDFNPNIRVLYIVSSDLNSLTPEDFSPFQNLITLHINNCSISRTTKRSLLSGLKTLTELQITHSQLSNDIGSIFETNTALTSLTLQWNNLTRITKDMFSHLKDIQNIDLSHNNISEVETGAFENMSSLLTLNLAHNKIEEHFDPALASGSCSGCGDKCSAACRSNESVNYLWRRFQEHYDILLLKGNPICSDIESAPNDDKPNKPTPGESQTDEKKQFLFHACAHENVDGRKRDRKSNQEEGPPLPQCTFTGTSGFCSRMRGMFISRNFNPNIRALYIVSSDLTYLTAEDFAPFQSLITLHINNCTILRRSKDSLLSGLKSLTALQITHSDLSDDIWSVFVENTALNKLTLQWNKLTRIAKDTLSHLKDIESIDVSHNDISEIERGAFENMPSLKTLNISYNKIGEHFDPTLASDDCIGCGGECSSTCRSNESADYLWQQFHKHYDIVFLKGNPVCSKIENEESKKASHEETRSDERKEFFIGVCSQEFDARNRRRNSHGEGHSDYSFDGNEQTSAEVGGDVSSPHADSVEWATLGSDRSRDPGSGDGSDPAALPLSSVEVDDGPGAEPSLVSTPSHLVLAASIGIVAVPVLIAAIIIGTRTNKSTKYEEVRAPERNDTDGIEMQVLRNSESQPEAADEALLNTVITHETPKEQFVTVPLICEPAEK